MTGSVVGNNDVAGIGFNKLMVVEGQTLPLSVNCTLLGNKGGYLAGVVGENWKGVVEKATLMLKYW